MELLDQLSAWLDEPRYEPGVLLYEQCFGHGFVLSMLQAGPDDYNRQTLQTALEEKFEQLKAEQQTRLAAYPEPLTSALDSTLR